MTYFVFSAHYERTPFKTKSGGDEFAIVFTASRQLAAETPQVAISEAKKLGYPAPVVGMLENQIKMSRDWK